MLPDGMGMEGCPESNNLLYLVLSALLVPFLFGTYMLVKNIYNKTHHEKAQSSRRESMKTVEFAELQLEMFGERALKNLKHLGSTHNLEALAASIHESRHGGRVDIETGSDTSDEEHGYDAFMTYLNGAPKIPHVHV